MSVREKTVPRVMSLSATLASVGICAWLWAAGNSDPRKYVSNMAISHHNVYGSAVGCYDCHIPAGSRRALFTSLTCATANCHGELLPDVQKDAAIADFAARQVEKYIADGPRITARAEHHLALHAAVRDQSCWSCHSEHTNKHHPDMPPGWESFEKSSAVQQSKAPASEYESLLGNRM